MSLRPAYYDDVGLVSYATILRITMFYCNVQVSHFVHQNFCPVMARVLGDGS
jgi:hypothetical protein